MDFYESRGIQVNLTNAQFRKKKKKTRELRKMLQCKTKTQSQKSSYAPTFPHSC